MSLLQIQQQLSAPPFWRMFSLLQCYFKPYRTIVNYTGATVIPAFATVFNTPIAPPAHGLLKKEMSSRFNMSSLTP